MKKEEKKLLEFDYIDKDKNFIGLTRKNAELIEFIIQNDSNYRSDNDKNNKESTVNLVEKYEKNPTDDNLKKIIKSIDKQNSTHLSVDDGLTKTTEYIYYTIGQKRLAERLKNGDITLVDDIAENALENKRYIISFASKFCTYMSRYMYNKDNFSIYDKVIKNILPYYYYKYVNKNIKYKIENNKKLTIIDTNNKKNEENKKKKSYGDYNKLIIDILKSEEVVKEKISRKDLDHILWYYYKGDKDKKDKKDNIYYESRITRAIKSMNENI